MPSEAAAPRRILLVRLRLVGDVVFTTPAIAAIKQRFPASLLDYLVEPPAAPVVATHPDIDELLIAPRSRGSRRFRDDFRLGRLIYSKGYDLVIDFHGGPRSAWLTWASRAPTRLGYDAPLRRWAYTETVPWTRDLLPARHSVRRQWQLLELLGIAPPSPEQHPVVMHPEPAAVQELDARLARLLTGVTDPVVIVLHVSAGNPFRRWPRDAFAEVAATLAGRSPRRRVVITSGPSETDAAELVRQAAQQRLPDAENRILDTGELTLAQLRALCERAALYIGGDSGPLHIASTSPVPIVALFGPTLPARSAPWRRPDLLFAAVERGPLPCRPCHQRQCVPGDFRCLTEITPAQVIAAAEKILDNPLIP